MAELVVALVVLLVLCAGILQLGSLCLRHSDAIAEARRKAAVRAMGSASPFASPHFISTRAAGADETQYSRDDETIAGDVNRLQTGIPSYAEPDTLSRYIPGNVFSDFSESPFPYLFLGLVDGSDEQDVPMWPIVRQLIYNADSVNVRGDAWLTWAEGVY